MTFTVVKRYQEDNNYINYSLECIDLKSGYCSGFHGYATLNEEQYKALRSLTRPSLIKASICPSNYDLNIRFDLSIDQIDQAGIKFLLKRKHNWATIDDSNGTNFNIIGNTHPHNKGNSFELVDCKAMYEVLVGKPVAKNAEEFNILFP